MNFLAVDKTALLQFQKHIVNKIITPDQNQHEDQDGSSATVPQASQRCLTTVWQEFMRILQHLRK